jgi:hypothetical protein
MSKEKDTQQMSLLEDSPANHSALQEKEKERMTTDTCGMKPLELLENANLSGSLAKMWKALLTSPMVQSCSRYNKTWKKRVSKSNVVLFQLQASVRGIKEKESGLSDAMFQTPTATEIPMRSKEEWRKEKVQREHRQKTVPPGNLLEQIQMMYNTSRIIFNGEAIGKSTREHRQEDSSTWEFIRTNSNDVPNSNSGII